MKPILVWHCCLLCTLALNTPVWADDGHNHDAAGPSVNANGPQRLPDGQLFIPKETQHQLSVRTQPVEVSRQPKTLELNATVVMDPSAGGKVQAMLAGRLEPSAKGMPSLGQRVTKGEVLAFVVASTGALERSAQAAQLAALQAERGLAEKRLARLKQLSDTVPRKDIEAAASALTGLSAQIRLLEQGLQAKEALLSPISGIIAASNAVAGQVVDVRDPIFEILDPTRLRIEALAYDPAAVANVRSGHLYIAGTQVPLTLVGSAHSLREQALPLLFQGQAEALSALALGQKIQVFVQSAQQVEGLVIPAAAVMKNAANQPIVWVKTAPEYFEPRLITLEVLNGAQVTVTSGLTAGERVVVQSAALINQIR